MRSETAVSEKGVIDKVCVFRASFQAALIVECRISSRLPAASILHLGIL